ncbi:phosphatidate cytidylyltransferase [Bifidobacterium gallicum]|uniref:Phosphatidate cytidylyltransferase n=1 Tax=Bifidobacterium gallicum DSM 20093 = LMG 11596 TaxID=561180 RepID=D1NTQ5_9BIFI|nr:phosphatidate cytidylyltransferase [Bifidobacterium gallicum]EFA23109.1 phosphatidate cytidylyltransferase [Bifidobacterium gallicum DSM 20093 = LMG 11596]KFI58792.1 CDP-diglyceride synthetase [Bifidobacterium gallicum DSM 20093 = LMG 11596]
MTQSHDPHATEAEQRLDAINKKTGRNMPQAIVTAVLLVAVILACLLINVQLFAVLVDIFMVLALWELRVDFAVAGFRIPFVTLALCSIATLASVFYAQDHVVTMGLCVIASLVVVAVMATLNLTLTGRTDTAVRGKVLADGSMAVDMPQRSAIDNVAVSMFTVLYIPLLASCIIMPLTFNGHPVSHAILIVFMPALSDTGGLFAGAWLGKHKLSPRISPKKSWEGLAGSILFAMAGSYAVFACTYDAAIWATRWWVPIIAGFIIGIAGTFGDLCASMLKRDLGIKDMGHLLKGHGGVLDRVDSILLAAPFICLLLWATGL